MSSCIQLSGYILTGRNAGYGLQFEERPDGCAILQDEFDDKILENRFFES